MNLFSYVVEHDLGFAPNPFHGFCTLACCKPEIRKKAKEGDYIIGTGATRPGLLGHITYWMRVDEILTFDEYWSDRRFRYKKPYMEGTTMLRYGDNIYHRSGGKDFQQEDSFHSHEDGSLSRGDLKRDTQKTERVLIGRDFSYWGRNGILLPEHLQCLVKKGPGHKCRFTEEQIAMFHAWLSNQRERGFKGEPAHWQFIGQLKRRPSRARR
ncbi:MAG: hypothetical protein ACK4NA_02125 [Alphaproteobacteria bacterium]